MNKNILQILVSGCVVLLIGSVKAQDLSFKVKNYCQSQWLVTPIRVDGKADEYRLPLDNYDPKTKVQYSMYNDDRFVYFCFLMTDETMQTKTLVSGMEIWIDTTGKKKKQYLVQFPLALAQSKEAIADKPTQGIPTEMKHDKYALTKEKIECVLLGFKGITGGIHGIKDSPGFQMAIDWDKKDILVYELKIPISAFHKILLPADSLKDFGLTIHIMARETPKAGTHSEGGSTREGSSGMHNGSMGGSAMGGGMRSGGMHNGGVRGNGNNSTLFEDELYHTKFRLSTR